MTQKRQAIDVALSDTVATDASPITIEIESHYQGLVVGLVRGAKNLPSTLEVYVGERLAGSVKLGRNRQESLPRFAGEQVLGFHFDALEYAAAEETAIVLKSPGTNPVSTTVEFQNMREHRLQSAACNIKGRLENVRQRDLQGWVFLEGAEDPVAELDIILDGVCIDRIKANLPRGDLAGKFGTGAHGFTYRIPAGYCDNAWHSLSIQVTGPRQNLNESMKSIFLPDLKGLMKNSVFSECKEGWPVHWKRLDHGGRATTCYRAVDRLNALQAPFGPGFIKMQMLEPVTGEGSVSFLSQVISNHARAVQGGNFEISLMARSEYDSVLSVHVGLPVQDAETTIADLKVALTREWTPHVITFSWPQATEANLTDGIIQIRLTLGLAGDRMAEIDVAGVDLGLKGTFFFETTQLSRADPDFLVNESDAENRAPRLFSSLDTGNLADNSELQDWHAHASLHALPAGWTAPEHLSSGTVCIAFPAKQKDAGAVVSCEGRPALGLLIERNPQQVLLAQTVNQVPKDRNVSLSLNICAEAAKAVMCHIRLVTGWETAKEISQDVAKPWRISTSPLWRRFDVTLNDDILAAAERHGLKIVYTFTGVGELRLFNSCLAESSDLPRDPVSTNSARETEEKRERLYQNYLRDVETFATSPCASRPLDGLAIIDLDLLHPDVRDDRTGFDYVASALRGILSALKAVTEVMLAVTAQPGPSLDMATAIVDGGLIHPEFATHVMVASGTKDEVQKSIHTAVKASSAQWILRLGMGDVLRADFADWIHAELAAADRQDLAAIVWDHDVLKPDGSRAEAVFKPGISPELMLERDYVCGAAAVKRTKFESVNAMSPVVWWRTLYDLFKSPQAVLKIDQVLQHMSPRATSLMPEIIYAEAKQLPSQGQLLREQTAGRSVCYYRLDAKALVSIIIPFKDAVGLLRNCIESIFLRSTYENYEVLIVDNNSVEDETFAYLKELEARQDSRLKLLKYPKPFNYSAINNFAARQAAGEYLAFVNSDVEVITPDWLERLTGFAAQDGVGLVGAKLHFADGTIQHAGIVVGLGGMAGHALSHYHDIAMPVDLAFQTRNVSAVTGACAVVRADRYWDIGGFDEAFIVAGNDVELGLRALKNGYRNVIANQVQLFHMEKKTRGHHQPVLIDLDLSMKAYSDYLRKGDPYWNRAISLESTAYVPRRFGDNAGEKRCAEAIEQRRKLVKNNLSGRDAGYLAMCDLSQEEFEANMAANTTFLQNPRPEVGVITWFVPTFEHFFRGGLYTIFRVAHFLSIRYGIMNNFAVCGDGLIFNDQIRKAIEAEFEGIKCSFFPVVMGGAVDSLPDSDLGVCTLWTTAYSLAKFNRCKGKFYFVQDYEPCFEPSGSLSGLIEQTYRMGFIGICNSRGVADEFRRYNPPDMFYFAPGVEKAIYHPRPNILFKDDRRPVRIAFYGRPANERNGFSLGVQALAEIKRRYRSGVEIISVGADYSVDTYNLRDTLFNAGTLPSLTAVADFYRSIDIGLVFMFSPHPSYQPLEYMATGCATIMNINESNIWLLKDGKNCLLAPATVTGVVSALCELIDSPERRLALAAEGFKTVADLNWPEIQERIGRFMILGEKSDMENIA